MRWLPPGILPPPSPGWRPTSPRPGRGAPGGRRAGALEPSRPRPPRSDRGTARRRPGGIIDSRRVPPVSSRPTDIARRLPAVIGLLGFVLVAASMVRAAEPRVVVLPTTGIVDQVMAGYLRDRIADAAASGATAVVVRLAPPGRAAE